MKPWSTFARWCRICVLSTLISIGGCAPSTVALKDYGVTTDTAGLQLDESAKPTLVYTRPNVPDLSAYRAFIVDPVAVSYSDPKMEELPLEQVNRIQEYFRGEVVSELQSAGYEVGTRSDTGRMRISLTITGLKAPSAAGNVSNALLPVSVSVGEVTVEAQFRNALADRLDAVVISRNKGSRLLNASPWSTWADVEASLDQWAVGFRKALDAAHKQRD